MVFQTTFPSTGIIMYFSDDLRLCKQKTTKINSNFKIVGSEVPPRKDQIGLMFIYLIDYRRGNRKYRCIVCNQYNSFAEEK